MAIVADMDLLTLDLLKKGPELCIVLVANICPSSYAVVVRNSGHAQITQHGFIKEYTLNPLRNSYGI